MWVTHQTGTCKARSKKPAESTGTAAAASSMGQQGTKSKGKGKAKSIAAMEEALSKADLEASYKDIAVAMWEAMQKE